MTNHKLEPMFMAKSIVLVGASPKSNSFGMRMIEAQTGFQGHLDYINPKHSEILGKECLAQIKDLSYAPDLAILGVGSLRVEQALIDAISVGTKSCVIFDDCHDDVYHDEQLLPRLKAIAKESGISVCGGNCMGFFNISDQRFASYYRADHLKPGGLTLIAHSGSVFTVLALSDFRYRFDLVISPGQEIGTSIDEYIDYAITRKNTKVIALFMEVARHPEKFLESLHKARKQGIPVVVCKVGMTQTSAKMAQSHTGAIAGSYTAYIAALESCGAIIVDTVDELMNTALLCSQGKPPQHTGGLFTLTDSGGLRENAIDRAEIMQAPLYQPSEKLQQGLKKILPPSLLPSNPLDCLAELSEGYEKIFENSIKLFDESDEVAMIGLECDFRDDFIYAPELWQIAKNLPQITNKPCFVYSSFSQANNKQLAQKLADNNVPLINGLEIVLKTSKLYLEWQKNRQELAQSDPIGLLNKETINYWRKQLQINKNLDEAIVLKLLNDFGLKTIKNNTADTLQDTLNLAEKMDYPLVLKTRENINHKSEVQGVIINLQNKQQISDAYQDLNNRIGAKVIIQEMVKSGTEISFGAIIDENFGAIVMVSAGGILVETLNDRAFAIAPFGLRKAEQMVQQLTINKLLDGYRGKPPVNKTALIQSLSTFSSIIAEFAQEIKEFDINPIIVNENEAIAVDALCIIAKNP